MLNISLADCLSVIGNIFANHIYKLMDLKLSFAFRTAYCSISPYFTEIRYPDNYLAVTITSVLYYLFNFCLLVRALFTSDAQLRILHL